MRDPLAEQALWAVGLEETLAMLLLQHNCHLKYVRIFGGAAIFTSHPGWLISQNATFSLASFCGAVVAREVMFITNVRAVAGCCFHSRCLAHGVPWRPVLRWRCRLCIRFKCVNFHDGVTFYVNPPANKRFHQQMIKYYLAKRQVQVFHCLLFFARWKWGLKWHDEAKLKLRTFCHLQTEKALENQQATFNFHSERLHHDSQGKAGLPFKWSVKLPRKLRAVSLHCAQGFHQFDPIRSSPTKKISKIK